MAHRIERVIDVDIPQGITEREFDLPPGNFSALQVVFDRLLFENGIGPDEIFCDINLYADGEFMGGASWFGGVLDNVGPRPGGRMLWSTGIWPLQNTPSRIRAVVTAPVAFRCRLDVDLF